MGAEAKRGCTTVDGQRLQAARAVACDIHVGIDVGRAAKDRAAGRARADRGARVRLATKAAKRAFVQKPDLAGLAGLENDVVVEHRRCDRSDVLIGLAQSAPVGWGERAQLSQGARQLENAVPVVIQASVARERRAPRSAVPSCHIDVAGPVNGHALSGPNPRLTLARGLRFVNVVKGPTTGRNAHNPRVVVTAVAQPAAKRHINMTVRKAECSTLLGFGRT